MLGHLQGADVPNPNQESRVFFENRVTGRDEIYSDTL